MAQPVPSTTALHIVECFKTVSQLYPRAFAKCHKEGDSEAWDFLYLATQACKMQVPVYGPLIGPNGKRGGDILSYDAIAIMDPATRNPSDVRVVDMVAGAGAPGATITYNDVTSFGPGKYFDPDAFTPVFDYGTGLPPPPVKPCPDPSAHLPKPPKSYPGDRFWDPIGTQLLADMQRAGQDRLNPQSGTWWGRTIWRVVNEGQTLEQSIAQSRVEWCAVLGIPVQ